MTTYSVSHSDTGIFRVIGRDDDNAQDSWCVEVFAGDLYERRSIDKARSKAHTLANTLNGAT